jgi:hypothetical protein
MQKDLIRTDEERAARLQLVKANRIQRQEKLISSSLITAASPQKSNNRVSHDVSKNIKLKTESSFDLFLVINDEFSFHG